MTLIERLLGKKDDPEVQEHSLNDSPQVRERITGKIIKVSPDGWGFITSRDIKFTRIFFHWSALNQDTLHFTELERGMEVEFEPLEVDGKGVRAIRIKVLQDEADV